MTATISFNKRSYGDIQLSISRKTQRSVRTPIDPQLILKQAELIKLKREVRYQVLTGFKFERVGETLTNVGKIINPDGAIGGYIKTLSDPSVQNNAVMEKIRWDLALLAGDKDYHAPTGLLTFPLPNGIPFHSHIQLHVEGELLESVRNKKSFIPRISLLRSLVMTVVYGGFDDHLKNMMVQEGKIIHFDNAATLSPGSKFINWGGYYMFCFRPVLLKFDEMENPFLPEELAFIKRELNKYIQAMPKFEAYFNRIDVQKMISKTDELVMDPKKSLFGMRERIATALSGLEGKQTISPRQWIFSSFTYLRVAVALHMVEKNLSYVDAIAELSSKCLVDVIRDIIAEKGKDPSQIIKIAIENEDMAEVAKKLSLLPVCDQDHLERAEGIAYEFIDAFSEFELKNGVIESDLNHSEVEAELKEIDVEITLKNPDVLYKNEKILILPNKTIIPITSIFYFPPLTVDEFASMTKGVLGEEKIRWSLFVNELLKNNVPVASGRLHTFGKIKASMLPNTFRVFQVRGSTNERFILSEMDAKGNVYSRDIGYDIQTVMEVKKKFDQLQKAPPDHLIGEFYNGHESYKVLPGECVGTYVIQVGKLCLPPMYPYEMQKWVEGRKRSLGLLKELNELNVFSGNPSEITLAPGEHILVQEKEASPMKFTIFQHSHGHPNVFTYRLAGEYKRGLRIVSETGVASFLDRKTLITRLKNGLKLDGDPRAGF